MADKDNENEGGNQPARAKSFEKIVTGQVADWLKAVAPRQQTSVSQATTNFNRPFQNLIRNPFNTGSSDSNDQGFLEGSTFAKQQSILGAAQSGVTKVPVAKPKDPNNPDSGMDIEFQLQVQRIDEVVTRLSSAELNIVRLNNRVTRLENRVNSLFNHSAQMYDRMNPTDDVTSVDINMTGQDIEDRVRREVKRQLANMTEDGGKSESLLDKAIGWMRGGNKMQFPKAVPKPVIPQKAPIPQSMPQPSFRNGIGARIGGRTGAAGLALTLGATLYGSDAKGANEQQLEMNMDGEPLIPNQNNKTAVIIQRDIIVLKGKKIMLDADEIIVKQKDIMPESASHGLDNGATPPTRGILGIPSDLTKITPPTHSPENGTPPNIQSPPQPNRLGDFSRPLRGSGSAQSAPISSSGPSRVQAPQASQNETRISKDGTVVSGSTDKETTQVEAGQFSEPSAWKNKLNVPDDGRPPSVRYNNPGASYPGPEDYKFGIEGHGVIGGGHLIGKFPTVVHGQASNFALFARKYTGMTIQKAVTTWRGGNGSLNVPKGFDPNQVITPDMANDPKFMIPFFKAMAEHEAGAGKSAKLTDEQYMQAFEWHRAGGITSAKTSANGPSRFFFDTNKGYSESDIERMVKGNPGDNKILFGGNVNEKDHDRMMAYIQGRGHLTHDYILGKGEPASGYGGRGVRFPSDQKEINDILKERGWSRSDWDNGKWKDWSFDKWSEANKKGRYSIEIDNMSPDKDTMNTLRSWHDRMMKDNDGKIFNTKYMLKNMNEDFIKQLGEEFAKYEKSGGKEGLPRAMFSSFGVSEEFMSKGDKEKAALAARRFGITIGNTTNTDQYKTSEKGIASDLPKSGVVLDVPRRNENKDGQSNGLYNPTSATALSGKPGGQSASRGAGRHQGVDMMTPSGSPAYAPSDGEIVKIGSDNFKQPTITIRHSDGTFSRYLHMKDIHVRVGDKVKGGAQIGTTGAANGVEHLHFERWSQFPNDAGHGLMNPRTEFGWGDTEGKLKKPIKGASLVGGKSVAEVSKKHADRVSDSNGIKPIPMDKRGFMNPNMIPNAAINPAYQEWLEQSRNRKEANAAGVTPQQVRAPAPVETNDADSARGAAKGDRMDMPKPREDRAAKSPVNDYESAKKIDRPQHNPEQEGPSPGSGGYGKKKESEIIEL